LYQNRTNNYTEEVNLNNNVNIDWESLKSVIHKTAAETLGKRRKGVTARRIKTWNTDIAQKIKEKEQAYRAILQSKSVTERTEYKQISNSE
jgi:hypothetical protein